MKKNLPYKLLYYISIEFLNSIFIIFLVFLSLSLLVNFVEEITFFKDKNLENFIISVFSLAISKTPNTIIELSIFIFLFSGILFFVKMQRNSEINTMLLSGVSKFIPILAPASISFIFGIFIITLLSPISSSSLQYYEETKRLHSSNDNLIVINNLGLWFMESLPNGYNIIRADKISGNDFSKLSNVTIYNLNKDFSFIKRLDSKNIIIKDKNWILENTKILENNNQKSEQNNPNYPSFNFLSSININDLKQYFSNADTISFLEIVKNIEKLNQRGYSGEELKVKFHKYLSLPIYLFGMILLSTLFTIGLNKDYNTLMYLFFGLIVGFFLYFLNDLSIAIGLSNKLPIAIAVWSPVTVILFLGLVNIIKINEK